MCPIGVADVDPFSCFDTEFMFVTSALKAVCDAHRPIAMENGPCSVCLDGTASHVCVPCGHVSEARKRATTTPKGPSSYLFLCSLCVSSPCVCVCLAHVVGFSVVDTCLCMRGVSAHYARTLPHLPRRMYNASTETNRSHAVCDQNGGASNTTVDRSLAVVPFS